MRRLEKAWSSLSLSLPNLIMSISASVAKGTQSKQNMTGLTPDPD